MRIDNVEDRRRQWIGSWETEPLDYANLHAADIGRIVIYTKRGVGGDAAEAGVLTSWRDGKVWARYTDGSTTAAADAADLVFGVKPVDGPGAKDWPSRILTVR